MHIFAAHSDSPSFKIKPAPEMKGAGFYLRNAERVDLGGVRVVGVNGPLVDADESVRME